MEREDITRVAQRVHNVGTNGKIALAVAVFVVFITTFVSFVDAGFDPSQINWADWAVKVAMNEAIAFVMMFAGETFYVSYCTTKEDGKYQTYLSDYLDKRALIIEDTQYFGQYLRMVHNRETKDADLNYLIDHGIENAKRILMLDIHDIPHLKNPYSKTLDDGTKLEFKSYTKAQIKIIKYVLEGGVVVKRMPKAFYLDKDNKTAGLSDYQQAGHIADEIRIVKGFGRVSKALSMVLVSALFAGITVKEFANGADAQTWYNLVSRLVAAGGGFWAGCRNSFNVNEIECRAFSLKTTMLSEYRKFLDSKPGFFKVTDEEVEAVEAVAEYEESSIKGSNDAKEAENKTGDVIPT